MKIMRYQEIMALEPGMILSTDHFASGNAVFNLSDYQGQIIAILGSSESTQVFSKQLLQKAQSAFKLTINNAAPITLYGKNVRPEEGTLRKDLSISENLYEVISQRNPGFTEVEKVARTEKYITAGGLQPYRESLPGQVPEVINRQALLALKFLQAPSFILLDTIFDNLNKLDKALLNMALQNIRHSEKTPPTLFFRTQHLNEALFLADQILVLSPTPDGSVGNIIPVPFERPRNRQLLVAQPAFKRLRKYIQQLVTDTFATPDVLALGNLDALS